MHNRHTDQPKYIPKKETAIESVLEGGKNNFKQFLGRQSNTMKAFSAVIKKELELYKINLAQTANTKDDELEDIETFPDRLENNMSSLSEYSKAASEKWDWIVQKRSGQPVNPQEEEQTQEDAETVRILKKCKYL